MADRYQQLFKAALAAYPDKLKQTVQKASNVIWNDTKAGRKAYLAELDHLKTLANRAKSDLLSFWTTPRKRKLPATAASSSEVEFVAAVGPPAPVVNADEPSPDLPEQAEPKLQKPTPAQRNANEELSAAEKRISDLHIVKT